ncbi:MAG: leucine-rich repeat protein [Prevotella sp.]|nr:leucine-rich repeat protein [Prevotella sp.]
MIQTSLYLKRALLSLFALVTIITGASAQDLSVTYKAREVRLTMSLTERNVIFTLFYLGELQLQEGYGDEILVYNKAGDKQLMSIANYLTVSDDVSSDDNVEHVLTTDDWAVLDEKNATLAQTLRSQDVEKVSLLFKGSTATKEVTIQITEGGSATAMTQEDGYCMMALTTFGVLTQQIDGEKMVYARNGEPLFYLSGDSPATAVFKLCDGVSEDDNFTYVITDEDRQSVAEAEVPGTAGKTLADLIEDVKSISMSFVGGSPSAPFDPYTTPLTFEPLVDGTTVIVSNPRGLTIEYSINGGSTWSSTSATNIAIDNLAAGTKVCLRGDNAAYGMANNDASQAVNIKFDKDCYVYGNVMSLVSSTGFATLTKLTDTNTFQNLFGGNDHFFSHSTKDLVLPATTLTQGCYNGMFARATISRAPELPATTAVRSCYYRMFYACPNLKVAPALPATTMDYDCYHGMFESCIALEEAPELPAMQLDWYCYDNMFRGCTALTKAPHLPATTLEYGCYEYMFGQCTNLETAPALPATTLAVNCYNAMFYLCSALVNAPELPATTLADNCYASMFYGCSSLEKAPELPAPILVTGCYNYMFGKCTKLNYVKCLATDLSVNSSDKDWQRGTNEWLYNVADKGTFIKAEGVNDWTIGTGGIPEGWTTEEVSTGISNLTQNRSLGETWYTLSGRRLSGNPTAAGIYVKRGKKTVVK